MKLYKFLLSFFVVYHTAVSSVGESAVITLIFPYGARACGMGEVGTALADDESALFFNPAGLATPNPKWTSGNVNLSHGPLLPALLLKGFWHTSCAGYYQPGPKFGLGMYLNYINMGKNETYDSFGRNIGVTRSWEAVFAFGFGYNLYKSDYVNQNIGISLKPFISALAPDLGRGTAISAALDIGYQVRFKPGIRLGIALMNIGPRVRYDGTPNALPLTLNLALAFKYSFQHYNLKIFNIAAEARFDKEMVKSGRPFWDGLFKDWVDSPISYELREINQHYGIETGILNTFYLRSGFLLDIIGERYEWTVGAGLSLFNHITCDYSVIISPEGFFSGINGKGASGIRHGQWRLSLTYSGFGVWKNSDFRWWRISD